MMIAGPGMAGAVRADAVEEAKQLQDAGDVTGAYDLLQKAKADLDARLKKNKSEIKSQLSALSGVSSMEKMEAIKEKNKELVAERNRLKDESKKVNTKTWTRPRVTESSSKNILRALLPRRLLSGCTIFSSLRTGIGVPPPISRNSSPNILRTLTLKRLRSFWERLYSMSTRL
jgi:hypothetical protein